MTNNAEAILQQALQLPEADREAIADYLWRSVDHPDHRTIDEGWADEAERRMAEIDEGKVKTTPWEQVMEELRSRHVR